MTTDRQRILCGTDFSVHAAEAADVAAEIAKRLGDTLVLIHANDDSALHSSFSVPTLVVRNSGALAAWARDNRSIRVVVAYDFSLSADAALAWVKQLPQIGPCEVVVVHVDWPPAEMKRLGVSGPVSLIENPPTIARVLERDLRERVTEVLGGQTATLRVAPGWGRPDAHIIDLAQTEQADLLVVGSHQRHGLSRLRLGSVSRGVLHHAPMSIAIVPTANVHQPEEFRIPHFQRVLVTTDFSNLGNRAIPFACAALRRGGTLHLLHVAKPGELPQAVHELTAQLRALVPAGAEARGIKAEAEVAEGHEEFRSICQAAERFGADLICMSSHGRTGIPKALLGSVTQAVIAHTQRPVLIAPRPIL